MEKFFTVKFQHDIIKLYNNSISDYSVITSHHIESYNKFLKIDLENIITQNNPIYVYGSKNTNNSDRRIIFKITFNDLFVNQPNYRNEKIYPLECLEKISKSYSIKIYINYKFEVIIENGNIKKSFHIIDSKKNNTPLYIGSLPCMIKSIACNLHNKNENILYKLGEDKLNDGGYFIVSGQEYAITAQENKTINMLYFNKLKFNEYICWIQSKKLDIYTYGYYTTLIYNPSTKYIGISIYISKVSNFYIPIIIFFRALGVESDNRIWDIIGIPQTIEYENLMKKSFIGQFKNVGKISDYDTMEKAKQYILKVFSLKSKFHKIGNIEDIDIEKRNMIWKNLLTKEFLPHIGGIEMQHKKIIYLGYMLKRLLRVVLGYSEIPNRDDYGNKRILTTGPLMTQLVRQAFMIVKTKTQMSLKTKATHFDITDKKEKIAQILPTTFNSNKFTEIIESAILNSEWNAGGTHTNKNFSHKVGISKILDRRSIMGTKMMLQQIATQVKTQGEGQENIPIERRAVYSTHWGCIDTHDTPEGKKVGLIKYKTFMSKITLYVDPIGIIKLIKNTFDVLSPENIAIHNNCGHIFVNHDMLYIYNILDGPKIYKKLIKLRRSGEIYRYTSIVVNYKEDEIHIYTDGGRMLWPTYIVYDDNKLKMNDTFMKQFNEKKITWQYLIKENYIEYISIQEASNNLLIALDYTFLTKYPLNKYTNCEITGLSIVSLNLMSIEMANKNYGPRISFQSNMQKQAIGTYVTNSAYRLDSNTALLCFPQKPLSMTLGREIARLGEYSNVTNITIAMITAWGKNIEDSTVIDGASIDRGLFDIKKIISKQCKISGTSVELFMKPPLDSTRNYNIDCNYDKLNEDGTPKIGTILYTGDIMIGKVKSITKTEQDKYKHTAEINGNIVMKYEDKSIIYDGIIPAQVTQVTIIKHPDKIMRVRLLILLKMQVGDKIAAISAQKAIVSTILANEDMIYDENGNRPQLLFNPTSIAKRMTLSHMGAAAIGYIANKLSEHIDTTVFNDLDFYNNIIEEIKKFDPNCGKRVMFNPKTGTQMKHKIFVGEISYQRLIHVIVEKVYGRYTGSISIKTRQPASGRSQKGGMRFGEMERDACIGHGATSVLKNLMYDNSDEYVNYISSVTGHYCVGNPQRNLYRDSGNCTQISRVRIPWTGHMVDILLNCCNISVKKEMEDNVEINNQCWRNYTIPYMTKYEYTALLSARATQLTYNASTKIKYDSNMSTIDIARKEYDVGLLDNYILNRKLPDGEKKYVSVGALLKYKELI